MVFFKFQGVLKKYQLISDKESFKLKQLKPTNFEAWGERPLKESLFQYAANEISLLFPLKAAMEKEAHYPEEDKVLAWSEAYKANRVDDGEFDYANPYKLHSFMPMDILKRADFGSVVCTGCGIKLAPGCFSKNQVRQNIQKCVVCKAVKLKRDVQKNREDNRAGREMAEEADAVGYESDDSF